jgi:3-phosphoshikimate 1-carboxyvinyltransferase
MTKRVIKKNYEGIISIPPSKSDTQRAILIASLGLGESIIKNCGKSKDEIFLLNALENLGVKVEWFNLTDVSITGISKLHQNYTLNLGESGLGFRLLTTVVGIFTQEVTLVAEGSLCKRPMHFFDEILPQLGIRVESNNGFSPITVRGPIKGNSLEIDGSLSSQFLSGLLIALPFANNYSVLWVKNLKSIPYVEMTIFTLEKFGIKIENNQNKEFRIFGKQKVMPTTYEVEGDWSSAAFWLVASALGLNIGVKNLSVDSLQADKSILKAFELANCKLIQNNDILYIEGNQRCNFTFDATHCPDLFPALAVFAALTLGKSKIKGVHRLIHKESNRALALETEFKKLGIPTAILNDEFIIYGQKEIIGTEVNSHNDHRIAMSLGILGMFSKNEMIIIGAEHVSKSYPNFWRDLEELGYNHKKIKK